MDSRREKGKEIARHLYPSFFLTNRNSPYRPVRPQPGRPNHRRKHSCLSVRRSGGSLFLFMIFRWDEECVYRVVLFWPVREIGVSREFN
jgi:hypothetical protein